MNSRADTLPARKALIRARQHLAEAGIADSELEAELLLRLALGGAGPVTRGELYMRLEETMEAATQHRLELLVQRRLAREPAAYIIGTKEFYGFDLAVTADVLIPRPETELLVEKAAGAAKEVVARQALPGVVDVGTGSGAIAIAVASLVPQALVYATDVCWGALQVAKANAHRHGHVQRIAFRHGDLLMPVDRYVDVIVANLPYVTTEDWNHLEPELRDHEPRLALDGGNDGLDLIGPLLSQAPRYLRDGGAVCLEFGAGQHDAVVSSAKEAFPNAGLKVFEDFGGLPRVIVVSNT